jgi:hypothetical protein
LLFGSVVGVLLACRSAIQTGAGRGDVLLPDTDKHQYQANLIVSWAVTGYWALTLFDFPPFAPDHLDSSLSHLAVIVAR